MGKGGSVWPTQARTLSGLLWYMSMANLFRTARIWEVRVPIMERKEHCHDEAVDP